MQTGRTGLGFTYIIAVIIESGARSQCVSAHLSARNRSPLALPCPLAVTVPLAGCLDAAFPDLLSGSQRGSLPQTDKIERVSGGGADRAVPARCERSKRPEEGADVATAPNEVIAEAVALITRGSGAQQV